ncbi:hypothetical protein BDR26DRAFT_986057, partial [Obelidium mucronatum]
CDACTEQLFLGVCPQFALANGKYLGTSPPVLERLSFVEKIVISQLRACKFTVSLFRHYRHLSGNAAVFPTPINDVASLILPLSLAELSKILVITFTGPEKPNDEEWAIMLNQATFLHVRASFIVDALLWLMKYNRHYQNIQISLENMKEYETSRPGHCPLPIFFHQAADSPPPHEPSVHQNEDTPFKEAASESSVSFSISGIGEEEFDLLTQQQKKLLAIRHVQNGGDVLEVGRGEELVSMFNNPTAWEKLFVCIHPYGYGGIRKVSSTDLGEIQHYLLYGSKLFQEDESFMYLYFSLVQIQKVCYGTSPVVAQEDFPSFAESLNELDPDALDALIHRFDLGQETYATTENERQVIQVADKINSARGLSLGSNHEKNIQKLELFSATRWMGTPTWFLTVTFSDLHNPITLSY